MSKDLINWHLWDEKTLEKAKSEHKSIFLFIGDSSSKWSKIMKQESFNNSNVAELLNERFIPIMLNQYERPDMERYYQKVYTLMNRQNSATPLTIFLTEELKPFYAASYIPAKDIDAQLGLEALLRVISKKYITDYDTLNKKGDEVLEYIDPKEENIQATKVNLSVIKTISLHTQTLLDKEYGGFTKAPKFPNASILELLLDTYELEKNDALLDAITLTLDNMSNGGFYDLEDGGFYDFSQDEAWREFSGEKTTYNNALLIQLYLRAYAITNKQKYKEVAFKTLNFMLQERENSKLFKEKNGNIITSWNALMVNALFMASDYDTKYKLQAIESLEEILSTLYVNGMLHHCKTKALPTVKAFLEDYSYLGETLVMAYQYTLDESFLIMATQFSNLLIEQYYQQGRWIYASNKFKMRENIHDTVLPSSISSALSLLMSISSLVDTNYKKFVFKTLELHSYSLMRQPLSSPKLSQVLLRYLKDDLIIKSNEILLKENMDKRVVIRYPYILFKSTLNDDFELSNSHSLILKEKKFEKLLSHIESL